MKYFENLNLEEDDLNIDIDIDGRDISVMLFLDEVTSDELLPKINQKIDTFLDKIKSHTKQCLSAIQKEYHAEDSSVKMYLQHHLEECPAEEIAKFVKPADDREVQLMESFALQDLSLFPNNEDMTARFDFKPFVEDFLYTDYLICVETDQEGNILDIVMES